MVIERDSINAMINPSALLRVDPEGRELSTVEWVKKVADLARLKFPEKDIKKFSEKAALVISYIEKLNELDVSNIEATSHATNTSLLLREDTVVESSCSKEILEATPRHVGVLVEVPKVLDNE